MIEIADQSFHRGIPTLRVFVHCRETEHIKIRPCALSYLVCIRVRLWSLASHRRGWLPRVVIGDDAGGLCRRQIRKIEWRLIGQQLVQNDPKRVDISRDADSIAANLFWRRIGRSHETQPRHGLIHLHVETLDFLRDAKIEKMHAAIVFHENVRGLKVAMNDGMTVGVLHRLANGTKEQKTLLNRALLFPAMLRERNTFDVLHHEEGSSVRQNGGV